MSIEKIGRSSRFDAWDFNEPRTPAMWQPIKRKLVSFNQDSQSETNVREWNITTVESEDHIPSFLFFCFEMYMSNKHIRHYQKNNQANDGLYSVFWSDSESLRDKPASFRPEGVEDCDGGTHSSHTAVVVVVAVTVASGRSYMQIFPRVLPAVCVFGVSSFEDPEWSTEGTQICGCVTWQRANVQISSRMFWLEQKSMIGASNIEKQPHKGLLD